jgi:hypothetical protein
MAAAVPSATTVEATTATMEAVTAARDCRTAVEATAAAMEVATAAAHCPTTVKSVAAASYVRAAESVTAADRAATISESTVAAETTITAKISITSESTTAAETTEPWPGANKGSAGKKLWTVVPIGRASVRVIPVVAIGTDWGRPVIARSKSNTNPHLRVSPTRCKN